nr:MAG TPA: hypothetical protein [Caudoviricetes sp.]
MIFRYFDGLSTVSYKCLKWYYYIIEEKRRQLILWVVFFDYATKEVDILG